MSGAQTSDLHSVEYSSQTFFEEGQLARIEFKKHRIGEVHSKAVWYALKKISRNALWMNSAPMASRAMVKISVLSASF